ncbi:MAG: hypothetical protein IPJ00_22830 [Saprospirales bacterium]|nr:hypothetical protein [Saprospirales bacterium]
MKSNPVKTLLTISMGFLGLFLAFDLSWAIWVALGVGVIGLFSDFLSAKIEYLWMKLAHVMGMIVPPVLLAGIFFLFLSPSLCCPNCSAKRIRCCCPTGCPARSRTSISHSKKRVFGSRGEECKVCLFQRDSTATRLFTHRIFTPDCFGGYEY